MTKAAKAIVAGVTTALSLLYAYVHTGKGFTQEAIIVAALGFFVSFNGVFFTRNATDPNAVDTATVIQQLLAKVETITKGGSSGTN